MRKLIAVILGLAIATFLFGGPELHHRIQQAAGRPAAAVCRAIDVPPHHREHHQDALRPHHHHEASHDYRVI